MWVDVTVRKSFASAEEFKRHRYEGYDEQVHQLALQMVQGMYDNAEKEAAKKHKADLVNKLRYFVQDLQYSKEDILSLDWQGCTLDEVKNALDCLEETMSYSSLSY